MKETKQNKPRRRKFLQQRRGFLFSELFWGEQRPSGHQSVPGGRTFFAAAGGWQTRKTVQARNQPPLANADNSPHPAIPKTDRAQSAAAGVIFLSRLAEMLQPAEFRELLKTSGDCMIFQSYSGSPSATTEKTLQAFWNILDTAAATRYTNGMQATHPASNPANRVGTPFSTARNKRLENFSSRIITC